MFSALMAIANLQFGQLDLAKQIELIDSIVTERLEAGETLYHQGEESGDFFILFPTEPSDGPDRDSQQCPEIEMTKMIPDPDASTGLWKVVSIIKQNSYFGQKYFVSNRLTARKDTARAKTPVTVGRIHPDEFSKWIHFRKLLILKEKKRMEAETESLRANFELEKQILYDELDQLRQTYKNSKMVLSDELKFVEAEIGRALREEYDAGIYKRYN